MCFGGFDIISQSKATVFLSIIIPVYNVAGYLRDCLDSIVAQEVIEPIEIILVDDGATDGSGEICDEYALKDERILVCHKENGGASDARNMGIDMASGEYLLFIDGDDYIDAGSLKKIIEQTKAERGFDVCFLNANYVYQDGRIKRWSYRYKKNCIYQKSREEVLRYLIGLSHFPVSPCIKLLKRSFVMEKQIYFTKNMICEDVDHTYKVLLEAETFNYYEFEYYYARIHRAGSVMTVNSNRDNRFHSTFFIMTKWIDIAADHPQKDVIFGFLAAEYIFLTALYSDISTSEKKKNKKAVERLSWLLDYGVNKKYRYVRLFYKLFGLKVFSFFMNKII